MAAWELVETRGEKAAVVVAVNVCPEEVKVMLYAVVSSYRLPLCFLPPLRMGMYSVRSRRQDKYVVSRTPPSARVLRYGFSDLLAIGRDPVRLFAQLTRNNALSTLLSRFLSCCFTSFVLHHDGSFLTLSKAFRASCRPCIPTYSGNSKSGRSTSVEPEEGIQTARKGYDDGRSYPTTRY